MLSCDHEWSTIDVLCKTDTGAMSYMDVEKMLGIYCHGFNNVSTLSLQHPWCIVRWTYYPTLRKRYHNVINLTLFSRHCENILNVMSWFDCCSNIINTTFIAYCELNLLSNFEVTLELVILTLWYKRHCIVCIGCTTLWSHHDVVTTLRVCWDTQNLIKHLRWSF